MNKAATGTWARRARANICSVRSMISARLGSPVRASCTAWNRIWSTGRTALEMAMDACAARPLSRSASLGVTARRSGSSVTPATMNPTVSPATMIGAETLANVPTSEYVASTSPLSLMTSLSSNVKTGLPHWRRPHRNSHMPPPTGTPSARLWRTHCPRKWRLGRSRLHRVPLGPPSRPSRRCSRSRPEWWTAPTGSSPCWPGAGRLQWRLPHRVRRPPTRHMSQACLDIGW